MGSLYIDPHVIYEAKSVMKSRPLLSCALDNKSRKEKEASYDSQNPEAAN